MNIRNTGILFVGVAMAVSAALTSCGSSSSGLACSSTSTTAVSEETLSSTSGQCASSDKVVMVSLESATESAVDGQDTGGVGYDVIPYKVESSAAYSFEVPDAGGSSMTVVLKDKDANELLRVASGETAVSAELAAGNYYVEIHNGGTESILAYLVPQAGGAGGLSGLVGATGAVKIVAKCRGCDMRGMVIRTNLNDVDWTDANLTGVDLSKRKLRGPWNQATHYHDPAVLNGAILVDTKMIGTNLGDASILGADLTGADLTDANMRHAKLTDAKLIGATLTKTDFTYATMIRTDLTRATGTDTIFSRTDRVDMTDAIMVKAKLTHPYIFADMIRVDMTDAVLTKAVMNQSDLTDAKFVRADLTEADMFEATITGADFTGAILYRTVFADGYRCMNSEPVGVCIDTFGEQHYP